MALNTSAGHTMPDGIGSSCTVRKRSGQLGYACLKQWWEPWPTKRMSMLALESRYLQQQLALLQRLKEKESRTVRAAVYKDKHDMSTGRL